LRARTRRAVLALLPALLLQGAWVIRTKRIGGPAQIRHFAFYGDLGPTLRQGGATLRDWLVPDIRTSAEPMPFREWLALAAALVLATLIAAGVRRAWEMRRGMQATTSADATAGVPHDAPWRLLAASGLLSVCYLGMLMVSRLVADPGIPLDDRLLSPLFLLATIAIATSIALWWQMPPHSPRRALPRVLVAGALMAWAAASAAQTLDEAQAALTWGSDFAGEQWRSSALLEWARTNGANRPLYSNWPSAVYFHLHRPARGLPDADEVDAFRDLADTLRAHGGVVLAFTVPDASVATGDQLRRVPGLRVIAEVQDGVVIGATR
jgi:hypothetical protein